MRIMMGLILLALVGSPAVAQQIRYVNDYLVITLRAGMGSDFKIIRTLPTGTRLQVLAAEGDYSQVRTDSGVEGWVLTQYLSDAPAARDRLSQAQAELASLTATNRQLSDEVAQLRETLNQLQAEHDATVEDYGRLDAENARLQNLAARPMELARDNESLRARLDQLDQQSETLSKENTRLQNREVQWWFIAGGGVLLMGVVMGLILPKFSRRKRSAWH